MKIKRFIFIVGAALAAMTMVGCEPLTGTDYNKAYIHIDGEIKEVNVVEHRMYSGGVVRIVCDDGTVYKTHSNNVVLVKE